MAPVAVDVTLYTAPGCCLCEELKEQLAQAARQIPLRLAQVDISGDEELEARFRAEIPVLFVGGRKVAKYRISQDALLRALRARS